MGNSTHKYSNSIKYDISISKENSTLIIAIHAKDKSQTKNYQSIIHFESSPFKQHVFDNEKLFQIFSDENNFTIDPIGGRLCLTITSEDGNMRKVPIQLEQKETNIFEVKDEKELKKEVIENLENPELYMPFVKKLEEEKVVHKEQDEETVYKDEYDKQIRIFQKEMGLWKKEFQQKMIKIKGEIRWSYDKWEGKYTGEIAEGIPNGVGIFFFDNGDRIQGQWKNGKRHGRSIMFWKDGTRWESQWKNGEYHGKQIKFYKDGRRIEYEFKKGDKHGKIRKYNLNGGLEMEEVWNEGRKIKQEFFDENLVIR